MTGVKSDPEQSGTGACELCGTDDGEVRPYISLEGRHGISRRFLALKWRLKSAGYGIVSALRLDRPRFLLERCAPGMFFPRDVRICNACGTGAVFPPIDAHRLSDYYASAYWASLPETTDGAASLPRGRNQMEYLAAHLDLRAVCASLEFGAGNAGISRLLGESRPGLVTDAVEYSPALRSLLSGSGLNGTVFSRIEEADRTYDLILASHSIEHVSDLRATLQQFDARLESGGHVFLEVPNCNDAYWRAASDPWWNLPHTYFFRRESFRQIAEYCGWTVTDVSEWGLSWEGFRHGRSLPHGRETPAPGGYHLRGIFQKR